VGGWLWYQRARSGRPARPGTQRQPPIIGARTLSQFEDNLGVLDVRFTSDQRGRLERASAVELVFPHDFLQRPMTRAVMFGDIKLSSRS
jgi:hypothetical protein